MDLTNLLRVLRCVECGASTMQQAPDGLHCRQCGVSWSSRNGILDLTPARSLPMPRMCDDPHYRAWLAQLAEAEEYFYEGNPLLRWVQSAGHRAIRRMARSADVLTLDLGCGVGSHRGFCERTDNVIGLDIDQQSLERARRLAPDMFVVRGDGYRLPFVDRAFDRVISVYNLEHLVHLDWALEEVARVLKDGGEFLVSVPTEGGLAWGLGRSLTSARKFSENGLDYRRSNSIDHCNCIWQIRKAIGRHFRVEKCARFPTGLPSYHLNLIVTWRLRKRG
jgi:phosphatidylethanolamine/phosphatidyl-N-methylethanolamine N-methyltransferase